MTSAPLTQHDLAACRRFWQCQPPGYTAPPDTTTTGAPAAAAKTISAVVKQTLPIPASAVNLTAFAAGAAQQACSALDASLLGSGPSCTATTVVLPASGGGRRLLQGGSTTIVIGVMDALAAAELSADKVQQVGAAIGAAVGTPEALLGILQGAAVSDGSIDLAQVAQQAVTAAVTAGLVEEGASPGAGPGNVTLPPPSSGPAGFSPPDSNDKDLCPGAGAGAQASSLGA
jgi:hypothetical protein